MRPCARPVLRFLAIGLVWALEAAFSGGQVSGDTAAPAGGYRVAGRVTSQTDGRALANARVTLVDANDSRKADSLLTGEDGRFDFAGVPAGKYALRGAKRGFISAAYDEHEQFFTAIVTGAGLDTETLELRLAPDALIAGRVLDEVGEPVRHATVTLYREEHTGVNRFGPTALDKRTIRDRMRLRR